MRWKLKDNCRHQYRSAGPVSDLVYRYIENLPGSQEKSNTWNIEIWKQKTSNIKLQVMRLGGQDNFKVFFLPQKTQELDEFQLFTCGIKINYRIQQMLIALSMKYYAMSPFQLG